MVKIKQNLELKVEHKTRGCVNVRRAGSFMKRQDIGKGTERSWGYGRTRNSGMKAIQAGGIYMIWHFETRNRIYYGTITFS
jgi:hypothetical protein